MEKKDTVAVSQLLRLKCICLGKQTGTYASHNFPYNCDSTDSATLKPAFPCILWHPNWGVLFPLEVYSLPHIQTQLDWADHFYWQDHGDSC